MMDAPVQGAEPDAALDGLEDLLSSALDRLFERPRALDHIAVTASDGWGHLPFASWLAAAGRPGLTIGLTARRQAFHAALCDALVREGVPGEAVSVGIDGRTACGEELERLYPSVARSLRLPSTATPPLLPGSIGLLHADADLWPSLAARWRPLIAAAGTLVLHAPDLQAREAGGEAFVFAHDGGLRVEPADGVHGAGASPAMLAFWRIAASGSERRARVRSRFASLGERWRQEALGRSRALPSPVEVEQRGQFIDALRERARLEHELRRLPVLEVERADAHRRADQLERRLAEAYAALHALERPRPAPRLFGLRRRADAPGHAPPAPPAPVAPVAPVAPAVRRPRIERVLFVAGEPDTAGAEFRCRRQFRAVALTGREARWIRNDAVGPEALRDVDLLILWRTPMSTHVETMIGLARAAGTRIAFDLDDLVIDPSFARLEFIDAIRTCGHDEEGLGRFFGSMRTALEAADFGVATTEELAARMRLVKPGVLVIPNGFDEAAHDLARLERRARALAMPENVLRIGYAAGTISHQRDFAVAAGAIADVLRARPDVKLVLFRHEHDGDQLWMAEFPSLAGLEDRIEWRPMVPVEQLGREVARFDIAIGPLETGNPFCEAKSEIKYIEAALAQVPFVGSPTGPYARAVAHGRTGFLAYDEAGWRESLLALIDRPEERARVGLAAYCDVLWRFGPWRTAELWDGLMRALEGPREAAREHELRIRRGAYDGYGTPSVVPTETRYASDSLRTAEVAIAVTSCDYAHLIEEALRSAVSQTLDAIELIVVDDASVDGSLETVLDWVRAHQRRFTRVRVERTLRRAGLGPARNAAFAAAEARWIMSLDADNRLRPECCASLLDLARRERAAFAYPSIETFGGRSPPISAFPYDPAWLTMGNYIDAMALIAKWAWAAAGGFYDRPDARGWEDYGLWCRLAELGLHGVRHGTVLAEYRVHPESMTARVTETDANKSGLVTFIEERHPWVRLRSRVAKPR